MLMNIFGHNTSGPEWHVLEKTPPGFSRVYYLHSGEVTYSDSKGEYPLKPGYLYIFPSSSSFSIRHIPEHPICCTHLHLDIFPYLLPHLVELEVLPHSFLDTLFHTITQAIDASYESLLVPLAETFEIYCKEHELFILPHPEITTVFKYIETHIHHPDISITKLSNLLGYNPQYFIHLFREAVGIPPYQYIINYRMKESMKLLKQKDLSIGEIAERVGYLDLKSFSRAFKNRYGLSPSQFRNCKLQIP